MDPFLVIGSIVLSAMIALVLLTLIGSASSRSGHQLDTEAAQRERAAELLFDTYLEQQLDSINTQLRAREALAEFRRGRWSQ